jgi:uncharacterized membrane protein
VPAIQARCGACHTPGGVEAVLPYQTYDQVQRQSTNILFQISRCLMPPADQPQLSSEERQVIMGWIVCGTMND